LSTASPKFVRATLQPANELSRLSAAGSNRDRSGRDREMERRCAQGDDVFDAARRSTANVFNGHRNGTTFQSALFAGSDSIGFGRDHRRSGESTLARSHFEQADRDGFDEGNAFAIADDAGTRRAVSGNGSARFSASERDALCLVDLSATIHQRTNRRL